MKNTTIKIVINELNNNIPKFISTVTSHRIMIPA